MGALLGKLANVQLDEPAAQADEAIYLWPDCLQAWELFWQLSGQWHVGMGGKTGLCLADVRVHLDEMGFEPGPERKELWELLLAAQEGALAGWAELRRQEELQRATQQQG